MDRQKLKLLNPNSKNIFKLKGDKHNFRYNILKTRGIINVYTK